MHRVPSFWFVLCLSVAWAQQPTAPPKPPSGWSVSGTVKDSVTGLPMAGVIMGAGGVSGGATSDSEGRFTLKNVPNGTYRITALPAVRGGLVPQTARSLTVANADVTSFDFAISPPAKISGRVTDQNKEPMAGVPVALVTREYTFGAVRYVFTGSTNTNDRGEYAFESVRTDRGLFVVAQQGARNRTLDAVSAQPTNPRLRRPAFAPTYYPNALSPDGAQAILLRAGESRESMDIQIQRTPSYCVDATVSAGAEQTAFELKTKWPASGASGNGSMYVTQPHGDAGKDGHIRLCDLAPGDYELTVTSGRPYPPSQWGTGTFTIFDSDLSKVLVTGQPKVSVSGEVDWDGVAPDTPPARPLTIIPQPVSRAPFAGEFQSPRISIPGPFKFDNLYVDDYSLRIDNVPSDAYIKDLTYGGRSILHAPLRPGSVAGDQGVKIVLARDGATVAAKVVDKDGNGLPDMNVIVLPQVVSSEATLAEAMLTGQTDSTGAWTSSQLAPGKYYVLATASVVNKSPEAINRLWLARSKAKEVDLSPSASVSATISLID